MPQVSRGLLVLLCWWSCCVVAAAQTANLGGPDSGNAVTVDVHVTASAVLPGGYGWVQVDLQNTDAVPHRVEVTVGDAYRRRGRGVVARADRLLEPGEARTEWLPLSRGVDGRQAQIVVVEDGDARRRSRHTFSQPDHALFSALLVRESAGSGNFQADLVGCLSAELQGAMTRTGRRGRRSTEFLFGQRLAPDSLPGDWRLLTGFDLIVVDGRARLSDDTQRAVAAYLEAGGSVMVLAADRLAPSGPLAQRVLVSGEQRERPRWVGLGRVVTSDAVELDAACATDAIQGWIEAQVEAASSEPKLWTSAGPVTDGISLWDGIPGIGKPPTGVFFILLLLFALLAGPVNYFYWWRQRRLSMLLLTVPLAGLLVTAAILGFGLLRDGLGMQGVMASATVLDQREHRASIWTERLLYAGLTPAALKPRPSTWLVPDLKRRRGAGHRVYYGGREIDAPFSIDTVTGVIGGDAVPARTVTTLRSSSVGIERARMRFKARDDGGFDALVGEDFGLADVSGGECLVLRDFDGRTYVGSADGVLRPQPAADSKLTSLLDINRMRASKQLPWIDRMMGPELEPGSYFALTKSNPAVDDLALEVEWKEQRHCVLGLLSEEDVLRD